MLYCVQLKSNHGSDTPKGEKNVANTRAESVRQIIAHKEEMEKRFAKHNIVGWLIAGDFNMVPWGESVQRIKQAAGNRYLGAFRNTHNLGGLFLPLPIDTVLVPRGATGTVELRGYMGSDHRGVLARIALR